ncbi:hypothetical protein MMC22_004170 [Lobaria immixta]|nr:hypothetical protein [Lobaria immixta]
MVDLTQTLAPAPEAIKDSYEHNVSQPIRKEANAVDYSLPSPLESFAQEAIDSVKIITDFLRSNDLPHPSFARDAPANAFLSAPDGVLAARSMLTEAALRLLQLARGPQEYIPNLAVDVQYVACLRWLTHFHIFQLVPLAGTISYDALASRATVSVKQLKTVMRMAMTSNLFSEPEPGDVSHTATSALLVTNPELHDWAVFMTGTTTPSANKLVEATEKWPEAVRKNETAYNIAFNTDLPFFEHLNTDSQKVKEFAGYMKHVQQSEGTALRHLVKGYDWAAVGKGKVIDVGGSSGASSIALARSFPDLTFVVQDLRENVDSGRATAAQLPANIASRISFQEHDFFKPQPVHGAEVYLLRMILHDWPDADAVAILRELVSAMSSGSRLVIMDSVLPRPGSMPSAQERMLRARDMTMLEAFNSLERDEEDWRRLLSTADRGMTLRSIQEPTHSVLSLLDIVYVP